MDIAVDGVKVLRAHVQGKPYLPKSGENWKLQSYGMQAERLLVELEMAPGQAFRVWARDYSYGLPAAARTASRDDGAALRRQRHHPGGQFLAGPVSLASARLGGAAKLVKV